jgi:hypothetical protein
MSMERDGIEASAEFPPNERELAVIREIAEPQKGARSIDSSNSLKLLYKGRTGAMYGYDPAE